MERNGRNTAGIRGKDDDRKLFVGGLPKPCSEEDITTTFQPFGEIESVLLKIDQYTAASRGFCFIVFKDASVVEKILQSGDIEIRGKKVDPRRVTKTSFPGKIFIGGITPELGEEKIREHFGQFGKITEVQWPYDKIKNQKKAYLFLTFENRDTVTELLRTPKVTVGGLELDVKKVKFNPETMMQQQPRMFPRGGPRGYSPAYPTAYPGYDYRDDYGYEDYWMETPDSFYDGYAGYDAYAAPYSAGYTPRAPRGGRNAGGYTRHAPY